VKFTNIHNLPTPLVTALTGDPYDLKGAPDNIISVTTLIAPPKQKILMIRHDAEIETDVSEGLWRLLGTACHYVVEQASNDEHLTEERWYIEVDTMEVYTAPTGKMAMDCEWYNPKHRYISGRFDLYDTVTKKLSDYKITSVWSWVFEKKMKPDHAAQLNINGFALRKIGFPVEKLSIMALFRDWSKTKAVHDYPDVPIPMKEIFTEQWTDSGIAEYIRARIEFHYNARELSDNEIAECSPEDRWSKPITWAMMKKGNKRASKVFYSKPNAEQVALFPGCTVEERPGIDTRCVDYCDAYQFCHYWKKTYGTGKQ
jgi:hypothetical protein